MRVIEIKIQNYKSICSEIKECRLKLDEKVTFLIGANEGGKTNILEAMNKFSTGGFDEEDIPYKSRWWGVPNPPTDLKMVSVVYGIETDVERGHLARIHPTLKKAKEITITRYYGGGTKIILPRVNIEREFDELLGSLKRISKLFAGRLRKYIGQYKRANKTHRKLTRSALLRSNVLIESIAELQRSSEMSKVQKSRKKVARLREAIEKLPDPLDNLENDVLIPLKQLEDLITDIPKYMDAIEISKNLWKLVPRFVVVPADSKLWLVGEYVVDEIINNPEDDESLMSIRRLLSLADLNLNTARNLRGATHQSRKLENAGHKVTEIIRSVWEQEQDIEILFEWHPEEGNKKLVAMIESEGHRGFPQDRSLGFRWFLEFYLIYATAQRENAVILFEEPGIHLHPKAQENLKSVIREKVSEQSQIVYTTHLPEMYDAAHPEGCRAVEKDSGVTKICEEYSPENQYTTWEVALRALRMDDIFSLLWRRNIIVEGPADWIYLLTFGKILSATDPYFSEVASGLIHIHPIYGTSQILAKIPFFFQPGVESVVLLDSDQPGKHAKEELHRQYNCPNDYIKKIVMVNDVKNIESELGAGYHELEDLFGIDYYASIVSDWLGGRSKISKSFLKSSNLIASQAADIVGKKFDKKFRPVEVAWHFRRLVKNGNTNIPEEVMIRFADVFRQLMSGFQSEQSEEK
jgi:predicted ATP-dependent endonuclease of OLD family